MDMMQNLVFDGLSVDACVVMIERLYELNLLPL